MSMTNYGETEFAKALEAFKVANQYVRVDFVKYLDQKIAERVLTGEDLKNPCNEIPQASFASIGFPGTHVVDTIEELMEYGFDRLTAERIFNPSPLYVMSPKDSHIHQTLTDRAKPQYKADTDTHGCDTKPDVRTFRTCRPFKKGDHIPAAAFLNSEYPQVLGDAYESRAQWDAAVGALGGWVFLDDSVALKPAHNAPVDSKPRRDDLAERAAYVGLSVEQYVEVMRAAQEKLNR